LIHLGQVSQYIRDETLCWQSLPWLRYTLGVHRSGVPVYWLCIPPLDVT